MAETAHLESGPDAVRIDILAWSTDEDRSQFVNAWNLVVPAGGRSGAAGARGGAGRGAQGGAAGRGGRGGAAGEAPEPVRPQRAGEERAAGGADRRPAVRSPHPPPRHAPPRERSPRRCRPPTASAICGALKASDTRCATPIA